MLRPEKIVEVRRLIAEGLTDRQIARRAGVGNGSVFRVRRNLVPLRPPRPAARRGSCDELPVGPIERCPHCGRLVEMPCRAALAENYRELHGR
jgi:hypothetical protein